MPAMSYDLDQKVFQALKPGIPQLEDWKGAASGIADYVATWGVERFWAMSRSSVLRGGVYPMRVREGLSKGAILPGE